MSMELDTILHGVARPPPESCEERGKRLKLEPESEDYKKKQKEPESESEEESDSEPEFDWNSKRIEDLEISDFSIYDDAIKPFKFMCSRFEYKNKAQRKLDEQIKVAMDEFHERSQNLSIYDAIAPPKIAGLVGSVVPRTINDNNRPRLVRLSKAALEKYNAENQGANFEFDDVIKYTYRPGAMHYITFQAKQSSNNSATIFQAKVQDMITESPNVFSCALKPN